MQSIVTKSHRLPCVTRFQNTHLPTQGQTKMPKLQLSKNPGWSRAVCLCGCGGRSLRTIARHSKVVSQQARLVLNAAYPVFDHPPPPKALQSPSIPDSSASANPHQDFDNEMHTDPPTHCYLSTRCSTGWYVSRHLISNYMDA